MVHAAKTWYIIPRIKTKDKHLFEYFFTLNLPFIVEGVNLGPGFTPTDLAKFYGLHEVEVICSNNQRRYSSMKFGEFLEAFKSTDGVTSLKVRVSSSI